jgi:hypothetical protein
MCRITDYGKGRKKSKWAPRLLFVALIIMAGVALSSFQGCASVPSSEPANCQGNSIFWAHSPESFDIAEAIVTAAHSLPTVASVASVVPVPGAAAAASALNVTYADAHAGAQAVIVFLQANPGAALQDLSSKVTGAEVLGFNMLYSLFAPADPLSACDQAILIGYLQQI